VSLEISATSNAAREHVLILVLRIRRAVRTARRARNTSVRLSVFELAQFAAVPRPPPQMSVAGQTVLEQMHCDGAGMAGMATWRVKRVTREIHA
jgi:hypothetical protein